VAGGFDSNTKIMDLSKSHPSLEIRKQLVIIKRGRLTNLNMFDRRGIDRIKRDISLRTATAITQTELWGRAIILSHHDAQ
jgi:hypothetical protein